MHTGKTIYSVSQLTAESRKLLESSYANIQVEGEISGLTQPASGHQYFNLKDENAQLRCVYFKNNARLSPDSLENGMHVLIAARVSLYEQRGDFQLIVKSAVNAGEGLLRKRFEQLKNRLSAEGLFDTKAKRSLPSLPKQVGIITSATGAAIHDVISVFKRRYPAIKLLLYPSMVQGSLAAESLVASIHTADARKECDVLILTRGGGSLEDLWPFNEEVVARAIHQCSIPLVSAVGHESDFTISDLVADVRAATPSAAAELLSPDLEQILSTYETLRMRLTNALTNRLETTEQQFDHLLLRLKIFNQQTERAKYRYSILFKNFSNNSRTLFNKRNDYIISLSNRLHQPDNLLGQSSLRRQNLQIRLNMSMNGHISTCIRAYKGQHKQLSRHLPENIVKYKTINHERAKYRLCSRAQVMLKQKRNQFESSIIALQALNPLQTLARGFATLQKVGENVRLSSVNELNIGDELRADLQDGHLHCKISKIHKDTND